VVQLPERLGPEAVDAPLGFGPRLDQSGVSQHLEVFGHGGLAQGQPLDQVSHRALLVDEQIQDASAVLLGENLEDCGHRANMLL